MRRTIQSTVDNELSRMVLDGTLNPGHHVTVDASAGRLVYRPEPVPAHP